MVILNDLCLKKRMYSSNQFNPNAPLAYLLITPKNRGFLTFSGGTKMDAEMDLKKHLI